MNDKFYIYHSDPSHAWLEVSRKECEELGIVDKISKCSYQAQDRVFLEEDCDAPLFIKAHELKSGSPWSMQEVLDQYYNESARIRELPSFSQ